MADLERCVDFLRRLVRTPSLPGEEREIAELVTAEMRALGFDEVRADEAGNVIGLIRGSGGAPPIQFNTHLDHVDVGDIARWPHPPFGGEIHDGRLWGRGAVDIKGPLAAQVYGVAPLLERRPPGDVYVTCVVQEEIGGVGARHLAGHLVTPVVIVGEPSSNTVRRGHRGRTELLVHLIGCSVHASVPERGINPLTSLGRFLVALESAERGEHPELGRSSIAPTLLSTDQTSANVIPREVWLACDWRNVPGETGADALAALRAVLAASLGEGAEGAVTIPEFERRAYTGLRMRIPAENPACLLPLDHPAVVAASRVIDEITGEQRPVGIWEFATDGGHYAAAGMSPVGFGPGDPYLAHTVDEQIEIAELEQALAINGRLALEVPR